MARKIIAAAVRLSGDPAALNQRLHAAEIQIIEAAQRGAQLVVLPEVFNTGYIYSDNNYHCAEPIDGPTVTWMKRLAAAHQIHLAGSLLLLGPEHITNSLMLVAPDGRWWRYDKNHPWLWERAYFREGRDITVAHTDIGTFGLLICVDVLSPRMFARYAGQVDALIVSACPPCPHRMVFHFPDSAQISLPALMGMPDTWDFSPHVFREHVQACAAWLGIPVIQTTAYGQFSSPIPVPWVSFGILLARQPALWRYFFQAPKAVVTAPYYDDTQIVDAAGNILARHSEAVEGFALSEITLADTPPLFPGQPPAWRNAAQRLALFQDVLSWSMLPTYRRGVRRVWGRAMAPVDDQTQVWGWFVLIASLFAFLAGWFISRRE